MLVFLSLLAKFCLILPRTPNSSQLQGQIQRLGPGHGEVGFLVTLTLISYRSQ